VSQVEVSVGAAGAPMRVEFFPADGEKCERCWRHTTDVSAYGAWPHLCARCQGALNEMGIEAPAAGEATV